MASGLTQPYQQQGTVMFGTATADTDVSTDVFVCTFTKTFDLIERPATFASGRVTNVTGNYREELTITFSAAGSIGSSGTFDKLINTAIWGATPSTTLIFLFKANPEPGATDNPVIRGTVTIPSSMIGGEVGTLRKHDLTLPVITSTVLSS